MGKIKSLLGMKKNSIIYDRYSIYLQKNAERIKKLHNIHSGQRCFLIGTGPSLNKTPLHLIKDEYTMGQNMLYKYPFQTTYYSIAGYKILQKHIDELLNLNTEMFFSCSAGRWYLRNILHNKQGKIHPYVLKDYGEIQNWNNISLDISKYVRGGLAVSFVSLQILLYLGFKRIYLVGFDCNYNKPSGQYFYSKHQEQYDRDWSTIFSNYQIIKDIFEKHNCKIYNATPNSNLKIFATINLEDVVS